MLTKVSVHDPTGRVPDPLVLPLTPEGRQSSDVLHISNIDGLQPVKATINTSSFGSIDGAYLTGKDVADRNIVIDLLPKPDWVDWDIATIRNHAYKYFMPRSLVRLVFESTERAPVEILGHVESCDPNIFSKDNEIQISVICPDPHFKSVDPIVVLGQTQNLEAQDDPEELIYAGTVPAGFNLEIRHIVTPSPTRFRFESYFPFVYNFEIGNTVEDSIYIELNSVPGEKYVRHVDPINEESVSIFKDVDSQSTWPFLDGEINRFRILSDAGDQSWTLSYHERYGGL